jgi:hypothetical protein
MRFVFIPFLAAAALVRPLNHGVQDSISNKAEMLESG